MRHVSLQDHARRQLFADWKFAVTSIAIFWLVYIATVVLRAGIGGDFASIILNRFPTIITGTILTGCIYLAMQAIDPQARIRIRAMVAAIASVAAAIAQGLLIIATAPMREEIKEEFRVEAREGAIIVQRGNEIRIQRHSGEQPMIFTLPRIDELDESDKLRIAADAAVVWLFFFAAWSAVYLAAVSASQVGETKRRLALAESAAQAAQVRALRYQVNPHFLFNTLNSLSSLVMTGRIEQAEQMLIALSTFFRTSLSLDPSESVTLAQEIQLQTLYLDIEKRRFPDRLKVDIQVPDELANIRVPALILQPIVENAIKYGVSRTRQPVAVSIRAERRADGRADLIVHNSAPAVSSEKRQPPSGTGTGLTNVCERLAAHYGNRAECRFGPVEDGYRVDIIVPIEQENAA